MNGNLFDNGTGVISRFLYWKKKKSDCSGCCLNCKYYAQCKEDCGDGQDCTDLKSYYLVEEKELESVKDMLEEGCEVTFVVERLEQMMSKGVRLIRHNIL